MPKAKESIKGLATTMAHLKHEKAEISKRLHENGQLLVGKDKVRWDDICEKLKKLERSISTIKRNKAKKK